MNIKKSFLFFVLPALVSFNLVSCGGLDFFNTSEESIGQAEQNQTAAPDQTAMEPDSQSGRISELESELSKIQQEQSYLQTQIQNKDAVIETLEVTITGLKKKLGTLEKTRAPGVTVKKASKPVQPAKLYTRARNLLLEKDYTQAADLFTQFIKTFPKDSLADNAAYWLAECHYSMAEYKKAILMFKNIEKQYPKSEKVPDALLKTGYSYLLLDDTNRAHHFLTQVIKKYPFSPAAEKAQEKLKTFK